MGNNGRGPFFFLFLAIQEVLWDLFKDYTPGKIAFVCLARKTPQVGATVCALLRELALGQTSRRGIRRRGSLQIANLAVKVSRLGVG